MKDELARIILQRRRLEPLGVLFERHVLAVFKEPHEVQMELSISGDSLQGAYEAWRDLQGLERHLLSLACTAIIGEAHPVAAPAGTVLERTHTGTWRGRQLKLTAE